MKNRSFITRLSSVLALLVLPSLTYAVPMTWNYSGFCTDGACADIPTITGTLTGDPDLFGDDDELNEYVLWGDLTSYSFTFGTYALSGVRGVGAYQLDGAGNIVSGSMTFGDLFALEFLGVGSATWSFTDTDCHWFRCGTTAASGTGSYTTTGTSVPEPATLSLLGLAMLGLGFAGRRRRS